MTRPNFYGIIPASVRYCEGLIPAAKLLYCEITALANERGYCWASNSYFADLYGVDPVTVSRWIAALANFGFISVVIDKSAGNQRLIYIKEAAPLLTKKSRGLNENAKTLLAKKSRPLNKKVKQITIVSNTDITTVSGKTRARGGEKSGSLEDLKKNEAPPSCAAPPQTFLESIWSALPGDAWRAAILELNPDNGDVDTAYYYRRCRDWSATKGGKSADWPATASGWIDDDRRKNKLVKLATLHQDEQSNATSTTTTSTGPDAGAGGSGRIVDIDRTLARTQRVLRNLQSRGGIGGPGGSGG